MEQAASGMGKGTSIALGIILIILGFVAILSPIYTTIAIALLLGIVLLVGGIIYMIFAWAAERRALTFLSGLLFLIIGILLLAFPEGGLVAISVLFTAFLIVDGIFRLLAGIMMRPESGWGWMIFIGLLGILLGALIIAGPQYSAAWVLGFIVGLYVFITGWYVLFRGIEK